MKLSNTKSCHDSVNSDDFQPGNEVSLFRGWAAADTAIRQILARTKQMRNFVQIDVEALIASDFCVARTDWKLETRQISQDDISQPLDGNNWDVPVLCLVTLVTAQTEKADHHILQIVPHHTLTMLTAIKHMRIKTKALTDQSQISDHCSMQRNCLNTPTFHGHLSPYIYHISTT